MLMGNDVMSAFADQGLTVEATLRRLQPRDFDAPGLGEWTVAELIAHLIRGAGLLATYLDVEVPADAEPACDRVAYFAFSAEELDEMSAGVAERSRADARSIGTGALVDAFCGSRLRTVERVEDLAPDALVHTFRGPMAVAEYAATRVLELTVHHMDLCRALNLPVTSDPSALAVTVGIIEGLLDGERPADLSDDTAFVLAATGRDPHPDPRLPVLR